VTEDLLLQLVGSAENVLREGLSDDEFLDYAEDYSRAVESFFESGAILSQSDYDLVLRLHGAVIRAVSIASGRSEGCGYRRSAVKAYLSAFSPRFGEGSS
jgi:hypothetical protein